MHLTEHICQLLYRYECVVVPNFGGFLTHTIGAQIDEKEGVFHPPSKRVTFNKQLKTNDGLLANYMAEIQGISYEKALKIIDKEVGNWRSTLKKERLVLRNIGTLEINRDQKIVFSPLNRTNYLMSSFGLDILSSSKVQRKEAPAPRLSVPASPTKHPVRSLLKYTAAAAVLMLGSFVWKSLEKNQLEAMQVIAQEKISKKIQEATFVIANPLPEISLNLVKKPALKYHLIAGSFAQKSNAERKIAQLQKKGFDAKVVNTNSWGMRQVAFKSFESREEAVKVLREIRKTQAKEAWLLIK